MRTPTRTDLVMVGAVAALAAYVAWPGGPEQAARSTPLGLSTSRHGLEQAIAASRTRIAARPGDTDAAVELADALLRKARVDGEAAHAIEAERALETAMREDPGNYTAVRMLGAVYLAQHRFRDAIDAASRAAGIRPGDAWNFGVLGDAYMEIGEYDRAFDAFDTMVRRRPDAASYARVAYACEIQGRLPDALRYMRMAADATSAHDPESLAWHFAQLGHLHFQMGDLDASAREFGRSAYTFPGHPYAEAGLARVAAARGEWDDALTRFGALLDRSPTPELATAVGDVLYVNGRGEEARREYARAESLEREGWEREEPQPGALARMLAERGLETDEAVRLAEHAARMRADIFTMDALAWAYYRAGRLEAARAASISARRTGTADRRILYHAAAIEHAAGNDQEARVLLERALNGHPSFDVIIAPAARALAHRLSAPLPAGATVARAYGEASASVNAKPSAASRH